MHPSYRACERHVAHSKGLPACWLAAGCWPAPRLAHEHTRAEHARHARTTRVRLASDAHALTLQHALTSNLSCRARVTGHWLPVGRLAADTSGAHTALQTRSPSPLPATMRHRHAVHAIHHRRCHRTQRHDDNDRDEDERHDEEDREHDGRCERVRFRSRLRLSRAMAHAHARCQACCT